MKKQAIIIIAIIVIIALIVGGIVLVQKTGKKELKLQTAEEMQNMLNTIYSSEKVNLPQLETAVIDVNDSVQVSVFTGLKSNKNVEELVAVSYTHLTLPTIGG